MTKSWNKIIELKNRNAKHRKGFHINNISQKERINAAVQELLELKDSFPWYSLYELADVLAILLHFAQVQGWSLKDLDDAILYKLQLRFENAKTKQRKS